MLSGSFQDALVFSHASAVIHHPIKENCDHPAATLRWPHLHAAAWAFCRRGVKGPPVMGHRPAIIPGTGVVWRREATLAQSGKATVAHVASKPENSLSPDVCPSGSACITGLLKLTWCFSGFLEIQPSLSNKVQIQTGTHRDMSCAIIL